ncbi:MAG: molybdopterin-dependent oxidoreductase, partial [Microbacteriaceae bacterium]|nr:molybdopterin-dependent oxidoreductase [Burkholderiaceae bacterium]
MAKALGKPVKLTWQREQDLTHDQYRPMALERVRAGLGAGNSVSDFWARNMSPSISAQRGRLPAGAVDSSAVEGLTASPYASTSTLREWCQLGACAPVSYWRSVGHSINAFAAECAIDELAVAAGADPYQFRRRLMTSSRHWRCWTPRPVWQAGIRHRQRAALAALPSASPSAVSASRWS